MRQKTIAVAQACRLRILTLWCGVLATVLGLLGATGGCCRGPVIMPLYGVPEYGVVPAYGVPQIEYVEPGDSKAQPETQQAPATGERLR